MKAECAWCGKWKEVYAWKESVAQDYDGAEVHAPICKDCYSTYIEPNDQTSEVTQT